LAVGLRRRGIDVTTTPDVGLLEATDAVQAAHAFSDGRVIFTQDEGFLAIHASGTPHPGSAYCKKDTRSIGDMIRGLTLIWEIYDLDEMAGRIEYL
jgi:hypothetical protein